jgi:hypothetical protein
MRKSSGSRLTAGDLVVVVSPYIRVTADGFAKADPAGLQGVMCHFRDPANGSWQPTEIPYGSICMLVDPAPAIVLFGGREVMIQKACIRQLETENLA